MTSIDLSSNNLWVQEAAEGVRKALKPILTIKGGELKRCGMRGWSQPVELDTKTGFWASRGMIGKPKRWILHATPSEGEYRVGVPNDQHGADNIGYFSNVNGTMLVMAQRIILGVQDEADAMFEFDSDLEWLIFIAMRQPLPRGTSCEIIKNLDLRAGTLGYEGQANIKSAKVIGLCLVAPANCFISERSVKLHKALVEFFREESSVPLTVIDSAQEIRERTEEFCSLCETGIADPTPDQGGGSAYFVQGAKNGALTETEEQMLSIALTQDARRIVLWGPDLTRMRMIRSVLTEQLQRRTAHIMASRTWTESSVVRVLRSRQEEILSFEQAEHLVSAGLLPVLLDKAHEDGVLLFDSAGVPVEPFRVTEKFSHLVLSFCMPTPHEIRQARLTLGDDAVWIKCATRISSVDIVADFFERLGVPLNEADRRGNVFSNMSKVLERHIYIDEAMLRRFMGFCVSQHSGESWGGDIRGQTKATLISIFNLVISPMLVDMPQASTMSLLDELSNTWELSPAQSQFLISTNLQY